MTIMAGMATESTVTVTLAHPLSPEAAEKLGITVRAYSTGETLTVAASVGRRLVSAGRTTINPYDAAAVSALFSGATVVAVPVDARNYIAATKPNDPGPYQWWETGLGDGNGMTLWIEDGT